MPRSRTRTSFKRSSIVIWGAPSKNVSMMSLRCDVERRPFLAMYDWSRARSLSRAALLVSVTPCGPLRPCAIYPVREERRQAKITDGVLATPDTLPRRASPALFTDLGHVAQARDRVAQR